MTTYDDIMETAKFQEGYVATYQVDVSRQMFSHHASSGRLERVFSGVYRSSHYSISENEDLIVAYLWSREMGVISHQSALSLYDLSDDLPKQVNLTYPPNESLPPQPPPEWVRLHRKHVPDEDRNWYSAVQVTSPERTLVDVAIAGFTPELFHQALDEARRKKLVPENFERSIIDALMDQQRKGT